MPADLKTMPLPPVEESSSTPQGAHKLSSLPILILNVHEHCNCRCLMCDIWQRKDGRELDLSSFARHRNSLLQLGVRQVVLTGGEPLLHRNFGELCSFLRDCGVRITLLTTGLLLMKRADIVADGVDEVIVSIDGPEEIHDRIRRVNGAYRLIQDGIRAVRGRNARMPFLGRSTIQKANHHLLRKTVSASKLLALDSISFLAADVTSQAFNRELVWPGEKQMQIALERHEVDALDNEINALVLENSDDMRSRYIVESPAKLRGISRRFREYLGDLSPVSPRCNAPWVSAVLEVDGSVRPCFFHKKIGSTSAQDLEQAINSEEAQQFRATLDVNTNAVCQRCVCSLQLQPKETPS